MKIIQINHFSYKAAGHIMMNIHATLLSKGCESYVAWGRGRKAENQTEYYMNDALGVRLHAAMTRITDRTGFFSKSATKELIRWIQSIEPDIIHLHCIHGYYIHIPLLFEYIKEHGVKVVWTQHDCWSFTGHCAYFDMIECNKWKTECNSCQQIQTYPASYIDNSKDNWNKKKQLFSGICATIVTPCVWLKGKIEESFLGQYPVRVIYNGIDANVFKPTSKNFRLQHGLNNKYVVLGVASEWSERKGLKDFIRLYSDLDQEQFAIVIVGLTKKQISNIPEGILAIERTNNVQELVDIYSSCDLFFNPTYEDNFPTTNLEALACGTPVLTYDTGGAAECISNEINGFVINKGQYDSALRIIASKRRLENVRLNELFYKEKMIDQYLELYNEIIKENRPCNI